MLENCKSICYYVQHPCVLPMYLCVYTSTHVTILVDCMVILSYRVEYTNPVHDLVASDPKLKSLIQYAMKVISSDLYAFSSLLSHTV